MKYDYKYFGYTPELREIIRPVIPVTLKYNNISIEYEALIDSGADGCVFSKDMADLIGIDLKRAKKMFFQGATGAPQLAFEYPMEVSIAGKSVFIDVLFSSNMRHAKYGILGQNGFFENFDVKLSYFKKEIVITPIKK